MKEKITIERTKYDVFIHIICILSLMGISLYLLINWNQLPDKIPTHFNFSGEIDGWGNKAELWISLGIAAAIYVALSIIERFPQIWNTGIKVTNENKEQVYKLTKNLLVTVKGMVVLIFSFITYYEILAQPIPVWVLPIILFFLFGFIIIIMVKLLQAR